MENCSALLKDPLCIPLKEVCLDHDSRLKVLKSHFFYRCCQIVGERKTAVTHVFAKIVFFFYKNVNCLN